MKVLCLSYDGRLEPLGQSQVLAYRKRLEADRPIHLSSFEKPEDWASIPERERIKQEIAGAVIAWHPLRYHKRPRAEATAWDVFWGIALGPRLVLRHRLDSVHARSYMSTFMARLLILGESGGLAAAEAQAQQFGIEASVFMLGFVKVTSPDYQQADLHVLSSTGGGLHEIIIAALEGGKPVVSTDCPSGPQEILSVGQFAHLVPVGDAVAPTAAMAESLSATHDTAALKARAQEFSIDKAVDRYEALLFPQTAVKAAV